MRFARVLPASLFLLAAAGTAVLGVRLVDAERGSVERAARERLRVSLKEAEVLLREQATRLGREIEVVGAHALVGPGGDLLEPPPPRPLEPLSPPPGRDPEADFFLAEGERAEAADGDLPRAAGLYRSAAAPGRDAESRAEALFRLAALAGRSGEEERAAALEAEFLAALPEGREACTEALLVRARRRPPDPALAADLAARLDGDGAPFPLLDGIRRLAGLDPAVFAGRRAALALRAGLAEFARRPPPGPSGVLFLPAPPGHPDSLSPALSGSSWWVAAWSRDGEGRLRVRLEPPVPLPEGVWHLEEDFWSHVLGDVRRPVRGDIRETLLPSIPGWTPGGEFPFHLAASVDPAVVATAARRSAWMVAGALAGLLLAGASALVLTRRAARRETEAARARADFVTRVGHDLRTPLAVIRMYAETLAAGRVSDPAEAREFAGVAAREAERLTVMVGQVLDLAPTSEAPPPARRRPADLAALAGEVAAWHRPLLERAGLRLDVRTAGPLPVLADAAALRGAVSNLIENAARHAASGGSVEVEAARDGTMAVVRVLDRGPGLPPGAGERVFDRFFRGEGAAGPGAGLGLALVREAAEAHGGTAAASNREGGGAVLELRIPSGEGVS